MKINFRKIGAHVRHIGGVIMSIGRFLQSLALTLVFPLLTYASAPGELSGLSQRTDSHLYPASHKELSKTPGGPFKFEMFILRSAEPLAPSRAETTGATTKEQPEAARPSEHSSLSRKVDLSIPLQPLFGGSSKGLTLIEKTYLDAYAILQESNSCSRFFGGPRVATEVLNSLQPRLRKTSLAENLAGIGMFGPITTVTDHETGVSYRLFEKALVNQMGPFYQSVNYRSQAYFQKIGYFPANTREARVSMLLHELGHLLSGPDGRWLLADDGGDMAQSAANTGTIMDKCGEQIKSLSLQRADAPRLEASARTESQHLPATLDETARDDRDASLGLDEER
jgi:hypothetical protein